MEINNVRYGSERTKDLALIKHVFIKAIITVYKIFGYIFAVMGCVASIITNQSLAVIACFIFIGAITYITSVCASKQRKMQVSYRKN